MLTDDSDEKDAEVEPVTELFPWLNKHRTKQASADDEDGTEEEEDGDEAFTFGNKWSFEPQTSESESNPDALYAGSLSLFPQQQSNAEFLDLVKRLEAMSLMRAAATTTPTTKRPAMTTATTTETTRRPYRRPPTRKPVRSKPQATKVTSAAAVVSKKPTRTRKPPLFLFPPNTTTTTTSTPAPDTTRSTTTSSPPSLTRIHSPEQTAAAAASAPGAPPHNPHYMMGNFAGGDHPTHLEKQPATEAPSTFSMLSSTLANSAAPLAGLSAATLVYGAASMLPAWLPAALAGRKKRRKRRKRLDGETSDASNVFSVVERLVEKSLEQYG